MKKILKRKRFQDTGLREKPNLEAPAERGHRVKVSPLAKGKRARKLARYVLAFLVLA
jgi:hypothetical protein